MKKISNKIIKQYFVKDYESFILSYLNNEQINILRMTNYQNINLNMNILLRLNLIIKKREKYYITNKVYNLANNNINNSFVTYFDGVMNAYGVVNRSFFNYPKLDLILLIKINIREKDNYIMKDSLNRIYKHSYKRFKSYEFKRLANDTYYEYLISYQMFLNWFNKIIDLDITIFNNIVTKVYIYYYQIDQVNIFNYYLKGLHLINNDNLYYTLLFYLNNISKDIPLWRYGGYSSNEIDNFKKNK